MRHIFTATCIGLLAGAAPLLAQDVPAFETTRDTAAQDKLSSDTTRAWRLRLPGELLSRLPLDDAERVLEFFPGFMRATSGAVVYRSDVAALGTYVDGVPVRTLIGDRRGILPSLNALESVSLAAGGVAASRTGSGVIEYTTISAGDSWTGDVQMLSDGASPGSWNQHLTTIELGASGPIPGVNGLRFGVAGHLIGQKYSQLPGAAPGTVYLASGVDTTITLAGSTGPVDVIVPEYVPWSYDELPLGNSDRSDVTAALTYGSGAAEYGLRYYRTGVHDVSHALDQLYNADAWRGTEDVAQMVSFSARSLPLPLGITGNIVLSHQRYDATRGVLDPRWANMNSQPSFGINAGGLGFLAERDDYPVTDPLLIALRSGVLPANELTFTTTSSSLLPLRQGVRGIFVPLRVNPYAMQTGFPISGIGNWSDAAISWATERRWYARAAVTREFGAHSVQLGGEFDRTSVESLTLPLAEGGPTVFREKPAVSAAFAQAATSIKGIRLEAGARVDHVSSDAMLPRIPGFVINVPDSLRGDAYILRPGTEPWQERLEPVVDCGGATPVCKDNFVPVASHTVVSPRLSASYGKGRFSARAGYGSYVQPRSLAGAAAIDLSSTMTNAVFPRDTDPVREIVAELGMRMRTTQSSWIDLQLFRLDVTNPILVRRVDYGNPSGGGQISLRSAVNGESRITSGVELSALQHLGTWTGILASFAASRTDHGNESMETRSDPMRAAGIIWFDLGEIGGPAAATRALNDVTVHVTTSWSQGGRYTRLVDFGQGELAGRFNGFLNSSVLAEELNASRLPSRKELDLRIAKGFRIAGTTARLVADVRNPLGIDNVHTVFAETGRTESENYARLQLATTMLAYTGGSGSGDIVIDEFPENDVNRYMMRRAEQRFGNGDGIYTTSEMTAAVRSYLDLTSGRQWMVDSERELRLGVEVSF